MNKLFSNIKIRWIFLFSPTKRVILKYMSLVVKMNGDLHAIKAMRTILGFLCDVEVIMGLTYIMPMLKGNAWTHQICSKLWNFCVWFMGAMMMCWSRSIHILLWSIEDVQWWMVKSFNVFYLYKRIGFFSVLNLCVRLSVCPSVQYPID